MPDSATGRGRPWGGAVPASIHMNGALLEGKDLGHTIMQTWHRCSKRDGVDRDLSPHMCSCMPSNKVKTECG